MDYDLIITLSTLLIVTIIHFCTCDNLDSGAYL